MRYVSIFHAGPQPHRIISPVWRPVYSCAHWSSEKLTNMESATWWLVHVHTVGAESQGLSDGDSQTILICPRLKGCSVSNSWNKWAAGQRQHRRECYLESGDIFHMITTALSLGHHKKYLLIYSELPACLVKASLWFSPESILWNDK